MRILLVHLLEGVPAPSVAGTPAALNAMGGAHATAAGLAAEVAAAHATLEDAVEELAAQHGVELRWAQRQAALAAEESNDRVGQGRAGRAGHPVARELAAPLSGEPLFLARLQCLRVACVAAANKPSKPHRQQSLPSVALKFDLPLLRFHIHPSFTSYED